MSDPIGDMLTRIRNAALAKKKIVVMPYSKMKERVAEILRLEGYVTSVEVHMLGVGPSLQIVLNYSGNQTPVIQEIHRVSTPGQRKYAGKTGIAKVRSGLGMSILSTSRGILTDTQARQIGVGGEVLCEVW